MSADASRTMAAASFMCFLLKRTFKYTPSGSSMIIPFTIEEIKKMIANVEDNLV